MNQHIYLRLGFCLLFSLSFLNLFGSNLPTKSNTAVGFIITEFPEDHQLFPRNLFTNKAIVKVSAQVYGISGYDQVLVKLYKNGTLLNTFQQTLSYNGNIANFTFNLSINAELSNHKMELFGVDNGVETIEASADKIVAGDVYGINGQSNAQAQAAANPSDYDEFSRSYTSNYGWNYINLSFPGLWGGRFAKKIITEKNIPVAIFNDAVGAQQIPFYLRNDSNPDAGNYGAVKSRLTAAGIGDKVRAMIWFQGEADGWTVTTEEYKVDFVDLYNDWNSDYNLEEVYLFQTRYKSCSSPYPYILEAHRQLANDIPGLHIMSTNNSNHDGCHFTYVNGYADLGDRIYGLINRDLYGGPGTNVATPDVIDASVSGNQIVIEMNSTNSLNVIGDPWDDFSFEGGSSTVTGGYVSGDKIHLELSGGTEGITGVSYLGHPGSANDWIVNLNDVGILSFYDFPISNPTPGGGGGTGGGPIDCANIGITTGSNAIVVSGLDGAPITHVQIFDENWSTAFDCTNNCDPTETVNLSAGQYYVYVKYYNASWGFVCQVNETITVGSTVIDNDNDGVPEGQDCDDNDAAIPTTPGTSCNDGDANTTNDIIQSDGCTCAGTTTGGIIDNDNDGVPEDQDCDDNDAAIPTTPGTSCNDGNSNTTNDIIQSDGCSCAGTTTGGGIDCDNIQINSTGTTITVSGLGSAPVSKLQVFNSSWAIVFSCYGDCADTETIDLQEGLYRVVAALNNSSWVEICKVNEELNLEEGSSTGGGTGGGGGTSNGVDLELSMTVAETEFIIYEYINYTLTLKNNGDDNATDVTVENLLPPGTVYSSHTSSGGGSYSPWDGKWTVGALDANSTEVLELRLFVLDDSQPIDNFAQVRSHAEDDVDSTPNNNNTGIPSEDDEAVVSLEAGERADNTIGIQLEQNKFLVLKSLFPNPANEAINLQVIANATSVERIQLFDSFGSLKQTLELDIVEGLNQFKLDIAALPTGVYIVLFESANRHSPIRFVKQRL